LQVVDKSDDNKISPEEFKAALPDLARWGVEVPLAEADATFAKIDSDKGGAVMFDEFADWAYQQKLDLEVRRPLFNFLFDFDLDVRPPVFFHLSIST
jgi:Ca2+-binding EF-hand superfamily protein